MSRERFRTDPERVVLGVRPGVTPNGKPPVRIFLGTEDAQHRAERVFFYSIEKHRDPARAYEVHLMKNLAGFARKGWRTGFTNYRFAIPDLAGHTGRAIYNDVDQIYLADPALLFDLEMGEHGYLAISPKDTSVMLIDCARMARLWNRQSAASAGKARLTNEPAATPGLWGPIDPGWNARDVEYREGESKVLHYTALHQQPWQPFPKEYSYHPNPLAYLWHELEREADAKSYQVFTRDASSAAFSEALAAAADARATRGAPVRLSSTAVEMIAERRPESVLLVRAGAAAAPPELHALLKGARRAVLDLADAGAAWPGERFDAVVAPGLLDDVPSEDVPWLLDELFGHAGNWIYLAATAESAPSRAEDGGDAHCGRRTAGWWRTRVAEAAARHPGISWHVDVAEPDALEASASFQRRHLARSAQPRVWALIDERAPEAEQVLRLAGALGWPFDVKRLSFNPLFAFPNLLLGDSLASIDRQASSPLQPPWPDLVIGWGRRSVPVARWIRRQSGGRARLVQLGRPRAPFGAIDLIVTTPQYRLPARPNVLHTTAPLAAPGPEALEKARAAWRGRLDHLPRPFTTLLVAPPIRPYVLDPEGADRLGRDLCTQSRHKNGSLLVAIEPGVAAEVSETLCAAIDCPHHVFAVDAGGTENGRIAALALADTVVLAGQSAHAMAVACTAGKPVAVYPLPTWRERLPGLAVLRQVLPRQFRLTYRGTPFQQTLFGRLADRLVELGLVAGPRDVDGVRRALEARGLALRLGEERPISPPRPLDDLEVAVARVRRLMSELTYAT
ncbi:MAG: ELM1/GtrOC1 family putative glycosyltransferase [Geminicoccaceae bacterium]